MNQQVTQKQTTVKEYFALKLSHLQLKNFQSFFQLEAISMKSQLLVSTIFLSEDIQRLSAGDNDKS